MRQLMIYSIPAAIILFGIVLIAPTLGESRYADPSWRREFENVDISIDKTGELSRKFYEAQARNLTPAARRSDLGMATISVGISIAALLGALGIRSFRDLGNLKTLSTPKGMCWLATVAWWGWVPAQVAWLSYTSNRGAYPWWADNVAIPIGGAVVFCLLGFPFVLWGTYISTRRVSLPVRVIQVRSTIRGLVATTLSILPLVWFVFTGVRAFWEG